MADKKNLITTGTVLGSSYFLQGRRRHCFDKIGIQCQVSCF
jgi:hypothetical protein